MGSQVNIAAPAKIGVALIGGSPPAGRQACLAEAVLIDKVTEMKEKDIMGSMQDDKYHNAMPRTLGQHERDISHFSDQYYKCHISPQVNLIGSIVTRSQGDLCFDIIQ